MKKLFTLFLTLFVASSVWAVSFNYNGLYYSTIIDGGFEVAVSYDFENDFTDITIPSSVTYDGQTYSVTSISVQGFYYRAELTSITIPNSVTSIGDNAFEGCTNLISISIPESVTSFGRDIFWGCYNLTSITIKGNVDFSALGLYFRKDGIRYHILNKNSVEVVRDVDEEYYYASIPYSGDIILPSTITAGNTYAVVGINGSAFWGCTNLTSITIPNSVTSIGEGAFRECTGLTSITIPNSVTSIGWYAFSSCTGLTSITIPNSVTSIGESAFYGCTGLTSITIQNSVTSIGDNAFNGCTNVTSISIPEILTNFDAERYYSPYTCLNNLTSITINGNGNVDLSKENLYFKKDGIKYHVLNKNSVEVAFDGGYINDEYTSSYSGNIVLSSTITAGNTFAVVGIADDAFRRCAGLTSVTIPNSVTSIGEGAFYGCTGLTSITIPNSVTSIGGYAFAGCEGLTSITIPNSVMDLYYGAFSWNPNVVEYIGPATFFNSYDYNAADALNSLKSIIITSGALTSAGVDYINLSYKTLQEIDLSNSENTEIPDMAFSNCYKLEKVTLPSQLESVGYKSFAGCTALKGISLPATVTKIDNSAFEDCRKLEQILFDGSELKASISNLETIGDWAFYNCHNLKSLEIPEGVTSIGDAAFYGCTYLQDLQLPSTLKSLGDNTFALCENLKSMTILAENPPSLYEKSFYNVDHTIPVSVPESSLKSYAETEYWKEFIHLKSTDGEGGETTSINGVSNATTVAIVNNQILVNGEAPAFVVTISGKKIANQNLKSGVYFVNVEGETVKVSVQ